MYSVVLDTNVIVAALRSRQGASFAILSRIGRNWAPLISVPLILEYEEVGKREAQRLKIPERVVEAIIHAFCFVAIRPMFTFGSVRSCQTQMTNSFSNSRWQGVPMPLSRIM